MASVSNCGRPARPIICSTLRGPVGDETMHANEKEKEGRGVGGRIEGDLTDALEYSFHPDPGLYCLVISTSTQKKV